MLGISRATVTEILGGRNAHRYNEKPRELVIATAQKMGYRPHPSCPGAGGRGSRAFSAFRLCTGHAWIQMARRHEAEFTAHPEWIVKATPIFVSKRPTDVKFNLEHPELITLLQRDAIQWL